MTEELTLEVGAGVEPGTYTAVLTDLTPFTYAKEGEEPKTLLRWTFGVDGLDMTVEGVSSLNTGPRSKAYQWMTGLLGREPSRGDGIGSWKKDGDTWTGKSPLVGRDALIGVVANDDGYPKLATVLAVPKGK